MYGSTSTGVSVPSFMRNSCLYSFSKRLPLACPLSDIRSNFAFSIVPRIASSISVLESSPIFATPGSSSVTQSFSTLSYHTPCKVEANFPLVPSVMAPATSISVLSLYRAVSVLPKSIPTHLSNGLPKSTSSIGCSTTHRSTFRHDNKPHGKDMQISIRAFADAVKPTLGGSLKAAFHVIGVSNRTVFIFRPVRQTRSNMCPQMALFSAP